MDRRRNALGAGHARGGGERHRVEIPRARRQGDGAAAHHVAQRGRDALRYAQVTCDIRHAGPAVADTMWAEVKAAMGRCIRLIREAAETLGVATS